MKIPVGSDLAVSPTATKLPPPLAAPTPVSCSQIVTHAIVVSLLRRPVEFSLLIAAHSGCSDPVSLPHAAPSRSMSATMTTVLGTSNLRGSSRQTRTNPTRTTKTAGPSLRQNSLISNPAGPLLPATEPHGFYPAIQHFADAITALPRDYRRHTSLLKEVDAKAWQPEEHLQTLLIQCAKGGAATGLPPNLHSAVGSSANAADEAVVLSTTHSVTGAPADAASPASTESAASAVLQCRHTFAALRHNLLQIMVTMDEKNHVINNANEELSRHLRRLDDVYPHLADEISEEARLGSLKHWAYTETNPTKKTGTANRREAAANLALLHENEVSQRSELRREAVAAKSKQRLDRLAQLDAGFEEIRNLTKKTAVEGKRKAVDNPDVAGLGILGAATATGKRKKAEKSLASMAMEKSMSLTGSRAMSREPSQQDHTKKRKAPTATSTVARKRYAVPTSEALVTHMSRLNAAQDSPKLASSPLAGTFGKDAYKRSPALGAARPAVSRARQNSTQRAPSAASQRNTNGVVAATAQETNTANTVKRQNTKETLDSKADRLLVDDKASRPNGDAPTRPAHLLERRASKQGNTRTDTIENDSKAAPSPRLSVQTNMNARGRTSKTSTPVIGTFVEQESTGANGNGNSKPKRPQRPRPSVLHGLHDSLSPKGLPLKRSHKKGAGVLAQQNHSQQHQTASQRAKAEIENTTPPEDDAASAAGSEEAGEGEDEERYCYCEGPSSGEMVACDNDDCPRQWFHIECLGLKTVPKTDRWFCSECDPGREKGKTGRGRNGNGGNGGNR